MLYLFKRCFKEFEMSREELYYTMLIKAQEEKEDTHCNIKYTLSFLIFGLKSSLHSFLFVPTSVYALPLQ